MKNVARIDLAALLGATGLGGITSAGQSDAVFDRFGCCMLF